MMNTLSILRRPLISVIGILATVTVHVSAQGPDVQPPACAVTGNASLRWDLYDLQSTPGGSIAPRRPSSFLRLVANPTITLAGGISLPFTFILSIPRNPTRIASPASSGLGDFLQDPSNSVSVSPKFGWAQFNLGTQTPEMSELSGGDIQLFGVGFDLTPGSFRIAAAAGTVGRSIAADSTNRIPGEYGRQAYMGKLAYVNKGTEFGLNVVRIRDDGASIPMLMSDLTIHPDSANQAFAETIAVRSPLMPLPEESFTATVNARVPITKNIRARAEVGGSIFTRDMSAHEIPEPNTTLKPLIAQRLSTRADLAGTFAVEIAKGAYGVSLNTTYIGAGYRTLAYPWMEADRFDVTLAPRATLLDDHLSLNGSIGWRRNNLSHTEEATTSQLLGSLNADARIGENVSLNAQYSNYGMRTPVKNDTFRVETVAQSFSVTPSITIPSADVTHVLSASASIDDYTDYNTISGASGSNRTHGFAATYSAALTAIPLSADISGSWMVDRISNGDLTIRSGSLGAAYRLLGGALALGATGTLTKTALGAAPADDGLTLRLNTTWRINSMLRVRADFSTTAYHYGGSNPGVSSHENLLRTSLQWQW